MREMRETNNTGLLGPVWLNGFLDGHSVNGASTQAELFKRYVCVCINIHAAAPPYSAAAWLFHLQNKSGTYRPCEVSSRALHVASGSDAVNGGRYLRH